MRIGTPGFVGERLRQAREAKQLTGMALAEILGVRRSSVSNYENGRQTPSPEVLARMAHVLNVKPSFLTSELPDFGDGSAVFWRATSGATALARRRGESRLDWLMEIVDYLREYVALPAVNYPPSVVSPEPTALAPEDIEQAARTARRFWGLGDGPISDVTLLLENNGTIVTRGELGSDTLDAFSRWMWDQNVPYIFIGTEKDSAARIRFSTAHELGHLLLHRYCPQKVVNQKSYHALMEKQAHRFAGAFLLPAERFREDLFSLSLDALLALKAQWNVSVGVMIQRVADLELATEEQVRRL